MTAIESAARIGAKVAALPLGAAFRRREGDVVILCYHRVGAGQREIDIPRHRFAEQLEWMAALGDVMSLDGALSTIGGGVVLSFDDGFRDFYDIVLPMLTAAGVPAVLYLATGFVDTGDPRSDVGPDDALTWGMLEEVASTGLVTIGSHTHRHIDLSRAIEEEADDEMRRSKELIEERLGRSCDHFAYPWGKASAAADRAARRHFKTAALDAWRINRAGRIELHRLGRTPIFRSDSGFFFRAKTRGQLDGERLAYRALRKGPWATS
jgi:peptidoglycan/xylan/chitin deacetylase (PgdA/CDA1 family)